MLFQHKHAILPVIHYGMDGRPYKAFARAIDNVRMAFDSGADGVFLINHGSSHSLLLDLYHTVRSEFKQWIGMNLLDVPHPANAFDLMPDDANGIWVDNAHVVDVADRHVEIVDATRKTKPHLLYFGGFAFKYQQQPNDLTASAKVATNHIDVITTSGSGTGKAADIKRIVQIREAIGQHPLAIASGITPENVSEYMPYVDCFLVATGISKDFFTLDESKLKKLVDRVRNS